MTNFEQFRPNMALVLDVHDPLFDEPVADVNEHLSNIGAQTFIDLAEAAETHEGMQYALVGGGNDRSREATIIMPGTFANGVWPHLIARAEAISYLSAQAGLRDSLGNLVPVLMTGSPGMKSTFVLSNNERATVASGNFLPIAERHIRLASNLGHEAVHGFIGSSQGAAVIPSLAVSLRRGEAFDANAAQVILAEPPHGSERSMARQGANFWLEGQRFKPQINDEDIAVINDIFASGKASPDFEKGAFRERADNKAIVKGFGHGMLTRDLSALGMHGFETILVHGTDSKVAGRDDMIRAVDEVSFGTTARLEIMGTNHSLMDRVGRFAVIAAANLTR